MSRTRLLVVVGAVAVGLATTGRADSAGSSAATTGLASGPGVPVLMYHVLSTAPAGAPFPELYVPKAAFAAEVAWLASHGFQAVTLQAVYDRWTKGTPLPQHPVVLSFDDGYRTDFTVAYRVLRARSWPGVLNLEVHNTTVSWGLSPGRVRRMIAAGWEVDAHTITHPDLTTLDATRLRAEVAGSRAVIRRTYGVPVSFFCYPAGRYDATVIAAVRQAGYLGATTTRPGLARPSELYTLARVRVNASDVVSGLAAKLTALGAVR